MATAETFSISRVELKKELIALGVRDVNVESMLNSLDKMHRHINAIVFAGLLRKIGLRQYDTGNILRRMGLDDVTIVSVFNALDEERIQSTFGKIVELKVE